MLEKDLIFIDVDLKDPKSIIENVVSESYEIGNINSIEDFYFDVIQREEIMSTNVGYGVAIPHAKSDHVEKDFISFTRLNESLHWGDSNEDGVDLVFLIGVSNNSGPDAHIRYLAMISKKLLHADFRDSLRNAKNEDEIESILNTIVI